MINLSVDARDLTRSQQFLGSFSGQLPFASSVALSRTARDVQLALKAQTTQTFDAPTAFTKNAFRYTKATKRDLVADVFNAKDRPYIATQSFGGARRWKNYEGFIRGLSGNTLPDRQIVPTRLAINAAGNPRRSLFSELKEGLSTTDRGGFFVGTPKGEGRGPGVYRRSRGRLFPYFLVTEDQPSYQPRFPFERLGNQTVGRVYRTHLAAALDQAVATARR